MAKRRPGRDPEMDIAEKSENETKSLKENQKSGENTEGEVHLNVPVVDVESGEMKFSKGIIETENQKLRDQERETLESNDQKVDENSNDHNVKKNLGSGFQNSQDLNESNYKEESISDVSEEPRIQISFTGSDVLKEKFPQAFEVAEKIATDWVHDGRFEGLPLGHPLAQYFAGKGLRKAKEIEKKVLESPVTEKVAMNVFTAGLKAQGIIQDLKAKFQKK